MSKATKLGGVPLGRPVRAASKLVRASTYSPDRSLLFWREEKFEVPVEGIYAGWRTLHDVEQRRVGKSTLFSSALFGDNGEERWVNKIVKSHPHTCIIYTDPRKNPILVPFDEVLWYAPLPNGQASPQILLKGEAPKL